MELNFDNREEINDFVSIPEGSYLCRIVDVRERQTRNEDALWALRLIVAEGEFTGRHAAWDNLVFSSRGLNRVRNVFEALQLPANGKVQVEPNDLVDKQVFVAIRPASYQSPDGTMVRRNEIPYDGYRKVDKTLQEAPHEPGGEVVREDDPLPF